MLVFAHFVLADKVIYIQIHAAPRAPTNYYAKESEQLFRVIEEYSDTCTSIIDVYFVFVHFRE